MIKIIPLPPNRVWRSYSGGKFLDYLIEKENPSDSHFPEDWIASLTPAINPNRENVMEEGLSYISIEENKISLKQLIEKNPTEILGEKHFNKYGLSTAFLIKLLDSASRLQIQCHPTIEFAKKYLNSDFGKTEGYYILGTREEIKSPYIFLGFQNPPSKENLKEAIEKQDIRYLESLFEKIPIKKGDAFFVPGGLPHAIGEGVLMIEIMEPTDLVVRLEFRNNGYVLPEKARFMDKGIDFALSLINFSPMSTDEIQSKYFITERLSGDYKTAKEFEIFDDSVTDLFRMKKLVVEGKFLFKNESFYILIITDGKGEIQSGEEEFSVKFGDKFFIPASTEMIEINTESSLEIIVALPPK